MIASFVPQGAGTDPKVLGWAASHPLAESVVRPLGLHRAFGAPIFLGCVFVLGLSTALCAWRRTRVAVEKAAALRDARAGREGSSAERHDVRIPVAPGIEDSAVLDAAMRGLSRAGMRARREADRVTAISPSWSAWGSPVFHWALFAVMIIIPAGSMLRSSGQMGLVVGQSRIDEPAAYGSLVAGPLHRWPADARTIRLDAFDLTYRTGGVNRGPTPTVTVMDSAGDVVASQRVYPNHTLKSGALTIYPADYGLAVPVRITDPGGRTLHDRVQLMDFSAQTPDGTVPVGGKPSVDDTGGPMIINVSVPLDRVEGGLAARLPNTPRARVTVTREGGTMIVDRIIEPYGETLLPDGSVMRIGGIGYYARLQLVEDPTIPLLYAAIVIAMLGLGVATLMRQHIVIVHHDAQAGDLVVRARLWRNVVTNREELVSEMTAALEAGRERVT